MEINKLEKYAAEAYALVKEADEATTYAGTGFKAGLMGGAAIGAGKPIYNWAIKRGPFPAIKSVKGGVATAALWGVLGGLGGGSIKRKTETPYQEVKV